MATLASDSFNRADNASIGTADVGGAYTQVAGAGDPAPFGISGNKALSALGSENASAHLNCGTPDVRITCTFTTSTTKSNAGLAARITNAANLLQLQFYNDGAGTSGLYLQKNIATVLTVIGSGMISTTGLATTYQIEWTISGTNHTVKVDTVTIINNSDSNAQDAVTNHGLWSAANSASESGEARWENLSIATVGADLPAISTFPRQGAVQRASLR